MDKSGGKGLVGSHFQLQTFGNELMISNSPLESVLSRMTLAVGKDSGWFEIDLETGEKFDWGREKGCRMFDMDYQDEPLDEFCHRLSKKSCSPNARFINKCRQNPFSDENYLNMRHKACHAKKIQNRFSQSNELNESICMKFKVTTIKKLINEIEKKLKKIECFDVECSANKTEYKVNMASISGKKFSSICKEEGEWIVNPSFKNYAIKCQNPQKVCQRKETCKKNCHQR